MIKLKYIDELNPNQSLSKEDVAWSRKYALGTIFLK
jgi:hypothetical protein